MKHNVQHYLNVRNLPKAPSSMTDLSIQLVRYDRNEVIINYPSKTLVFIWDGKDCQDLWHIYASILTHEDVYFTLWRLFNNITSKIYDAWACRLVDTWLGSDVIGSWDKGDEIGWKLLKKIADGLEKSKKKASQMVKKMEGSRTKRAKIMGNRTD